MVETDSCELAGEYVNGMDHTNGIESVCAVLKQEFLRVNHQWSLSTNGNSEFPLPEAQYHSLEIIHENLDSIQKKLDSHDWEFHEIKTYWEDKQCLVESESLLIQTNGTNIGTAAFTGSGTGNKN